MDDVLAAIQCSHTNSKSLDFFQVNDLGGTLWQPKCHSAISGGNLERLNGYQAWIFGGSKLPRVCLLEHS